ncbi:Dok-7 isoform X2 [Pelobates cultripes]|uniref:Dok-7 isoform X2 n=1 Tax=Pelobates cultripes TaxID=61616 RepID=A0AAD1SE58_PELCU|nr:Dok-7 isoform X2 [Pelobates cultripes]CAH2299717.1 Dok-7 isoform X2 [Pelobates cultripes]
MTDSVVVEGQVRLRDGKKWKNRWVVFRKPSPVADCLLMLVYKEKSDRIKGHKEKSSVTLEDICGLDPGLSYEGMSQTLAIVCFSQVVMLGFDNKDIMNAWDVRLRYSLGEVHRFHVGVLPGTKLECGPATLHLCNDILVLARDLPPVVIGQWKLTDLRRYGAVANGFVFEGGTRCGYWAGVFFLSCAEGDQISFLFDCIVRGISPTKGPFGLRPVLPDPNLNPADLEDRVAHETLQLEKRLSILSHQSLGGDDRSISSSSSDTSHSDASAGSRLTIWPEASLASTSAEGHGMAAAKGIHLGEDKAYAEAHHVVKPPPKPVRSRQLQEIGRQSSSDSGIATGSHSSYSGSFSSYAESLDICQCEEFGSLLSLPLNLASDQNVCTCQHSNPQRGSEYQIPGSVRHLYDTPRSLLQSAAGDTHPKSSDSTLSKDQSHATQGISDAKLLLPHVETREPTEQSQHKSRHPSLLLESKDSGDETYMDFVPRWTATKPQSLVTEPKSSDLASSAAGAADACDICGPHHGNTRAFFSACPVCGGLKGASGLQSGLAPTTPTQGAARPPKGHVTLTGAAGAAGYPAETLVSDRPRSETATYVNIPISPTSKKPIHYTALELQEPSTGIRGSGSTRYAQIDIAATETAHKVGSQHAQSREERLQELEQKKKGSQP